ncbi:unnamed protein product [Spirodela intermedia]|uniref:RRM domain-containing protein n=1 Tax=Spirodela intermedia TaxID=51605 RepID=A0A7I8JX79_SPIIN|nr:unnamed protein product [Spirodela intermedia]
MGDFNDAFMRNRDTNVQARTKAQNRATVLQLKLIGQSHPTGLTANLLKLFEPRPQLDYKPPLEKRKCPSYTGIGQFVSQFAEPGDSEYAPPVQKGETAAERRARIHALRLENGAAKAAEELQKYDPSKDPNVTGDPYKTLFVARLNYETTEHRLKREFESYGPIKRVRLITDRETNKPRGYAFIEYMHTRDMKNAYKQADGRKIDSKRVLVDVERGRTVANWRPRRLGGGLGSTRVGGEEVNLKGSGRDPQQAASGQRPEEPRAREDRHVDREREKSRERGRERDREREKSHERSRDREVRDDRHHHHRDRDRDRDRNRDRDRDRERERRDRGGGGGRERGGGGGGGGDRNRERDRERERDYDRSHSRGRDAGEKEAPPDYDPEQGRDWYGGRGSSGGHYGGYYDNAPPPSYEQADRKDHHRGYEQGEHDDYRGATASREKERAERSHSGEYEY